MSDYIDVNKLKSDLIDYYGTAMLNASPMAMMELSKINKMSDIELINMAIKNNFDLNEYKINLKKR